jgi:hypothetical protein
MTVYAFAQIFGICGNSTFTTGNIPLIKRKKQNSYNKNETKVGSVAGTIWFASGMLPAFEYEYTLRISQIFEIAAMKGLCIVTQPKRVHRMFVLKKHLARDFRKRVATLTTFWISGPLFNVGT